MITHSIDNMPDRPEPMIDDACDPVVWGSSLRDAALSNMRADCPEYIEWLDETLLPGDRQLRVAQILVLLLGEAHEVQMAKGLADTLRDEWVEFAGQQEWCQREARGLV